MGMTGTTTLPREADEVTALYGKAMAVMARLRENAVDRETKRKTGPLFGLERAAELARCTPDVFQAAAAAGEVPRRYSLAEIDAVRDSIGTRPWRGAGTKACVIACQNFKGSVGKSTISVHLAQYLAMRGYRVCLVDCDSQASATMMFGYVPDVDLTEDDTLCGYFHDDSAGGLRSRTQATHFHGLDLVPANLKLYNLEYEIAARIAQQRSFDIIDQIRHAIGTISDDYDVILLDPPPALGMISLGVLAAANALVIPMPPNIVDFSSTASFLDMLHTTIRSLEELTSSRPVYDFIRLVASKANDAKSMHREILHMSAQLFGTSMLASVLKDSAEIDNAISRLHTVYELDRPITSRAVRDRCLRLLDAVNAEIEVEIRASWARQ